jgi:uncharacterized protein DUF262
MDTLSPDFMVKTNALDVRISAVQLERHLYDNYPPFQRDKVWAPNMKRYLIDSILRGFYVPAILVYRETDAFGAQKYWVIDGQQRLSTIFEFLDNKFPTMRRDRSDEPNYVPVEPNKLYRELSQTAQNRLLAFTLHFRVLEDIPGGLLGVMFRRLQYQQRLTSAEKLWSYTSKTTQRAVDLRDHEFWDQVYVGDKARKRTFQASLYLIFVELFQGFVNVTTPRLKDLASGAKDNRVDARLIQTIRNRMDVACHVFAGASAEALVHVIPIYQAVMFLEKAGYDLRNSQRGCLAPWFEEIKQSANLQEDRFGAPIYNLDKTSYQKQFWEQQLPVVEQVAGLIGPRRAAVPLDEMAEQSEADQADIGAGISEEDVAALFPV